MNISEQISELTDETLQYPLRERIGDPYLFVGRGEEFKNFHQWIERIPKLLSRSRVLLARRKSGKTAFIQRLYNQLWSVNGDVIPFYINIPETKMWYPNFVLMYYRAFASQYISFLERDPRLVHEPLTMEEIKVYGEAKSIDALVRQVDMIMGDRERGDYDLMWETAYRAPERTAISNNQKILVMIDEFQYLSNKIYARIDSSGEPMESMPGSFHDVAESKDAPMLVSSSYVGWMLEILRHYLRAGRLVPIKFSPYLDKDDGLIATYRYAHLYNQTLNNQTAVHLNKLCKSDPFFISCIMENSTHEYDLTTRDGVTQAVNNEVSDDETFLSQVCAEYIDDTLDRVNDRYAKHMLLHLSKHNDREWTCRKLKEVLKLPLDEKDIQHKLTTMVSGDLLAKGSSDIRFRGLKDGTLNKVLRARFEEEILEHQPDFIHDFNQELAELTKENRQLRGQLSQVKGVVTEFQFANAMRSRKRFYLRDFFEDATDDVQLNLVDVRNRIIIQREDGGKQELDIVAQSSDDRTLLVEIKNRQEKTSQKAVEDFFEKVATYQAQHPDRIILKGFLSLNGFTKQAVEACQKHEIAWTTELQYF